MHPSRIAAVAEAQAAALGDSAAVARAGYAGRVGAALVPGPTAASAASPADAAHLGYAWRVAVDPASECLTEVPALTPPRASSS